MFDVVEVKHIADDRIFVRFEDGASGEIDLRNELEGPVFELLRNADYFRRMSLDPDLGTITWPNGADFAPEFLYAKVHDAA